VASTIATSDGPPDPAEPVRDVQSRLSVRLLTAPPQTLRSLQWWPDAPAGRPSCLQSPASLACRASIGRRQLREMRFWRRTGLGTAHTESLYQNVSIPMSAQQATLSLWLSIATEETTTTNAYGKLYVQIRDQNGAVLKTLVTYSNLDETAGYVQKTFDVSVFRGQNIQVFFRMVEDNGKATSFKLDDVTLTTQ